MNPVIGFAGILLLAFTLKQNQIALNMTAVELSESRKQLAMSADALKKQEQHMSIESAERTVLFICHQLEMSYNTTEQTVFGDSSIKLARNVKECLDYDDLVNAESAFADFKSQFNNALFLLVMLSRSTCDKEDNVREHLLMVAACKLDLDFISCAYTTVTNLMNTQKSIYNEIQLQHVKQMIEQVSIISRFDVSVQRVFKLFSIK